MPSDTPPETQQQQAKVPAKTPPPAFETGAQVQALVPRSIEEAWRLAQYFAESGLAPRDMKTPAQILAAIMMGAEVGLPPVQAIQSIAVINGRTTMWGDGLLAVVLARKIKVKEWMEGEGDERVAWCRVTRPDDPDNPVERYFSVEDAKEAGLWNRRGSQGQETPWVTYKRRMLQMRARSWAIRDGCADITRGLMMREEAVDITARVVAPELPPPTPVDLASDVAAGAGAKFEIVDADFVEEAIRPGEGGDPPPPAEETESTRIKSGLNPPADPPQQTTDQAQQIELDVQPEASALSPSKRWVAQVRAAFAAAKTSVDFTALAVRWASDLNTRALTELRAEDPAEADALLREYEALEAAMRPKRNGRRKPSTPTEETK